MKKIVKSIGVLLLAVLMFAAGNWCHAQKKQKEVKHAKDLMQDVFIDLNWTRESGDMVSLKEKLEYLPTQWTNVSVSGDIGKEVMEFVQGYREINKK